MSTQAETQGELLARVPRSTLPFRLRFLLNGVLPCLLLVGVVLALYWPSLHFGFVWDDSVYIQKNYRVQGLSPVHLRAIWTNTYLGHYAPIHHTLLAVLYYVSGGQPFGFHLGQLLIHAACACLLFFILKRITADVRVAGFASLLFAVHPANVETVAWISESKSTLAFLLFLISFRFFLRFRERESVGADGLLCGLFFILSMLAKINTIVAPAVFLAYDYKERARFTHRRIAFHAVKFFISAAFVAIHLRSFHGSASTLENTYYGGLGTHLLNLPLLLLFYLRQTAVPHPLSAWHMMTVYQVLSVQVVLSWVALLALVGLVLRASRDVQFWSAWFVLFLAPVLQIIPFPIWVADRYLYIPAIGLFVLAARLIVILTDRASQPWAKVLPVGALAASAIVFTWQTHSYLPSWKSDLALWSATTPGCDASAYCHANFGLSLLREGYVERGTRELIRAVELRPAPRYLTYLGDAYTVSIGDFRQALIAYHMAESEGGSDVNAEFYAKLARCYIYSGDLNAAEAAIRKGKQLDAYHPYVLVIDGFLEWKRGRLVESRQALATAFAATGLRSDPAVFLDTFWGRPSEVRQLIADLRANSAAGH